MITDVMAYAFYVLFKVWKSKQITVLNSEKKKREGLCRGQLKLAFNNNQGHHQTCLTRWFFFVGLDFMTSVHLERSFGQENASGRKSSPSFLNLAAQFEEKWSIVMWASL